jgi:long-chain acyl-CoA synthetase
VSPCSWSLRDRGYWVGPDRIDAATCDGWYHSGDLMRQGEDDELWFVDRKHDIIISGRSNISPGEVGRGRARPVEPSCGARCRSLRRAGCCAGPAGGGRRATASGVGDAAFGDILSDIKQQLADYKVPELLLAVDAVPRKPLGKVDRWALAWSWTTWLQVARA